MRFVALDVGDKTIGVAASDELGWAHPVRTIRRTNLEKDLDELAGILEERGASRIVIGLPLNMDGTEGPRAAKTRRFGEKVAERFPLPVLFWDERLTTWEAEGLLRDAKAKRQKRKDLIDAIAAQIILGSYLEAGAPETGLP